MKYIVPLFLLLNAACGAAQHTDEKTEKETGMQEDTLRGIDWDQFAIDLKYYADSSVFPIHPGVFPTPVYESEGNGSLFFETLIAGKRFVGRSVFVYSGDYNRFLFTEEKESMVYFTILVETSVKAENEVFVSSRNHPVYVAQGSIATEKLPVDWVAVQPGDHAGNALISMRYFDLSQGRLVIVCPQDDKSLRFLQVRTPFMDDRSVERFVHEQSAVSSEWRSFVEIN